MFNNNDHQDLNNNQSISIQRIKESKQSSSDNSTLQTTNYRPESNVTQTVSNRSSNTLTQLDQISQPLFQQQTLIEYLSNEQKQKFLTQINGLWMFQEAIQIILSVITILDFSFDNFFFNFDKSKYRAPLYLFFIISISLLCLVVLNQNARSKQNSFFIFLFFTLTYALGISGLISGYHYDIWNIERSVQIGFAIFIGTICNFLTLITIQIHFSLNKGDISFISAYKFVFFPPIIYTLLFMIFNPFDFLAVIIFWMSTEIWAAFFGGLYLYSVLQIINGKFELHSDQAMSAALLTFANMFFPF